MSRTGQAAAVASAAAVLGVGYWYGTLDDTTSTTVTASGSTSTSSSSGAESTASSTSTAAGTSSAAATATSSSSTSAAASSSAASGTTGQYTGSTESDRYGDLTVTVTLSAGKITDISYTSTASDGHSLGIESQAIPTLKSEAIAASSASIDSVSGATYTSTKYKASLQAALDKA